MKGRLRKKLHVGEFVQLGFEATFKCTSGLDEPGRFQLLYDFVEQAVEENELAAGGGGDESMSLFVMSDIKNRSVTEEQRKQVREWLSKEERVKSFEVGQLKDAWQE